VTNRRPAGEAIGDPGDHVGGVDRDDLIVVVSGIDPSLDVGTEGAQVGVEGLCGDDGNLLVVTTLDDEERHRGHTGELDGVVRRQGGANVANSVGFSLKICA